MRACCLVTGGAGFIGCAAAPRLLEQFEQVVVVDNLHPQVHALRRRPAELAAPVVFVEADVCEAETWDRLLERHSPAAVLHLAAETGTGQSLTEATRHAQVNVVGLTRMLDSFSKRKRFPAQVVLTSSRAVYGEGAWRRDSGQVFYPGQRDLKMLEARRWDFPAAEPLPFIADATEPHPTSVYGATKLAQEQILRAWGQSFGVATTILRLQNVYGPGQSLTNSYTGIVSLFAQLARRGESIPLYEDGLMRRDFVFIADVAQAIAQAFHSPFSGTRTLDIGSGAAATLGEMAELIAAIYRSPAPHLTGAFRQGDVRHASCDIEAARRLIGYRPEIVLREGLARLCGWIDAVVTGGAPTAVKHVAS